MPNRRFNKQVANSRTPMRGGGNVGAPSAPNSSLGDIEPGDPGVDISALMGSTGAWREMIK